MLVRAREALHEPLEDGRTHPSLTVGRSYVVVAVLEDDFHLVNDRGEPIIAPRSLFDVIDDHIPEDWVETRSPDEEWYWKGPRESSGRGFFERWHDEDREAREVFARVYSGLWKLYRHHFDGVPMVLVR